MEIFVWPLTVIILVVFGSLLFRKSISSVIGRIGSFNLFGNKFYLDQQRQQQPSNTDNVHREIQKQSPDPLSIKKVNTNIDGVLASFRLNTLEYFQNELSKNMTFKEINSDAGKIEYLKNYNLLLTILKHFDNIFFNIFGSQIMLLNILNSPYKQETDHLKKIFEETKRMYPDVHKNKTFEEYVAFLVVYRLIFKEDETYRITDIGVDFLKYLAESNKSLTKLF